MQRAVKHLLIQGAATMASTATLTPESGAVVDLSLCTVYLPANVSSGDYKASVIYATADVLPNSPTASGSGVGKTLTAGSNTTLTVDGVTVAVGERVLVKNQASSQHNGIYTLTAAGSGAAPWVLTRATDFDTWLELPGAVVSVESGFTNAGSQWVCNVTAGGTIETTAITFTVPKNYLDLTSNQTVAGVKTFSSAPVFTDQSGTRTALGLVIGTDVQAQDAELAAIAGLTSAADKLAYFTGSGTAALATFTAAGRALLDDADAAAQRATLGLVIGTDVQAYDAELAAIAGLTSAADKGIQFTGAGTAATFDLTTAGKALLDDATAAAQRVTLSIGAYTQSDTAPISPVNGDKWLDTTTGIEYVRYDAQWISDAPAPNLTTNLTLAYRAITALLTLDSSDYTVDCTANSFTTTLPTAVGIGGRVFNIKNTGNGLITVATTSNQTIDGAASGTITLAQYACLTVQSTGANWIIL